MFIQEKNPYDCSTCRKSFTKPAHLKEQKLVHKGDKPYNSETCKEGFVCFSNFIRHKRVHTLVVYSALALLIHLI